MGKLRTSGPLPLSAGIRRQVKPQHFATQVQARKRRRRRGIQIQDGPVFVSQISRDFIPVFGAVLEGAGNLGKCSPFLGIPAEQRHQIDRLMAKIVVLEINTEKRQSTQQQEQSFPLGAAEPVAFLIAKPDVELVIFPSTQIELVTWEDPEGPHARVRGVELRTLQPASGRKCEGS